MKPIEALHLTQFIVATYPEKKITPLKLQKLAYYAKVWSLVAGQPHIAVQFQKWAYGPVNTTIYHAYQKYGNNIIPVDVEGSGSSGIKKESEAFLKFVLGNYVDYSAFALSTMTHNEDPWKNSEANQIISEQAIVDYYSSQPFAKNFSNGTISGSPFHVLQTESWHAFTLDMFPDDVKSLETFPSYHEYESQSEQTMMEFETFMETLFNEQ